MPPKQEGDALSVALQHWLQPARAGSSEALGRVLESCRQYLLLIANEELDPELRAKVGPSDLVQESLLKAQQHFGQLQGSSEEDVLAWMRRILLNHLANVREHYRSTQKREIGRETPLSAIGNGSGQKQLATGEPSPSKQAAAEERSEELERAMAQLPEHYREALRLRHQEHCTFAEMGRRTGRSAEAARKMWARAVEQLKHLLKPAHDTAQ
jgi:RNA polymerase sigma-70 factor (ECF subfamily)